MEYISKGLEDTEKIAYEFADTLKGNEIILLEGDLGAGKTTFTKSLAKALGIKEHITSPTFTLVNEYHSGKFTLYHFDMYRLEDEDEAIEIGLDEYFNDNAISIIEWPERIKDLLPQNCIKIKIEKIDDNSRKFIID